MKEKVEKWFKTTIVAFTWVATIVLTFIAVNHNSKDDTDYNYQIYRARTELAMQGIKDDIVTSIDNYIDSVAPDNLLNGIKLFELCDKYGVDVRFAMAQAQVESHFGTKGMAAKTNIVWNVKTYDGDTLEDIKKRKCTFKHPDESIEPYLLLLVNDYFVDGKTEEDMFINFVNHDNKRYASNTNYEDMMLNVYNRINENTNLKKLIREYKRYKMILS